MYVCLCRGVTDGQIRQAVHDGVRTMRELRIELGVCSSCGRCGQHARELLEEAGTLSRPAWMQLDVADAPAAACDSRRQPA